LTDQVDGLISSLADVEIALSSHYLLVIEVDGSPVVPQRLNSIILAPGQRASVILEPHPSIQPREGESFWLRLKLSDECFNMPSETKPWLLSTPYSSKEQMLRWIWSSSPAYITGRHQR